MLKSIITDGKGNGHAAHVTTAGQLIVSPYDFDLVQYLNFDVAAQGYTFFSNKTGYQFVMTGLLLTADSNVVTSCIVDIYEATILNSATINKSIFHFEILKNGSRQLIGLNILINEGVYINGKTDDDDVFATMMGYYIPTVT